jgi:structural maintenance of chromosome 4
VFSAEELEGKDEDALGQRLLMLESERDRLRAEVDMTCIEAWRTVRKEHASRVTELEAATASRDKQRVEFEGLRKKRLDEFMAGFSVITLKLKEMYQMITLGGDAELELVDSMDPFSEGIVFSVRPPKKSWKNISNLSGGEKTLSSLALVFALHYYKPTPLYVMDEIDAALDFKNVSIVANYIKERTKNAQFVIISLRNNMFELADRLVGIYKTHDVTKSVTINPSQVAVAAASAAATGAPGKPTTAALGDATNGAKAARA